MSGSDPARREDTQMTPTSPAPPGKSPKNREPATKVRTNFPWVSACVSAGGRVHSQVLIEELVHLLRHGCQDVGSVAGVRTCTTFFPSHRSARHAGRAIPYPLVISNRDAESRANRGHCHRKEWNAKTSAIQVRRPKPTPYRDRDRLRLEPYLCPALLGLVDPCADETAGFPKPKPIDIRNFLGSVRWGRKQ